MGSAAAAAAAKQMAARIREKTRQPRRRRVCPCERAAYTHLFCSFCSLAVLDPRVGHTMDVLSPFIPVLCHFD